MVIEQNVCLADKNWFKVGGKAQFFAQPNNEKEFGDVLLYAAEHALNLQVFGEGANILISDAGVAGLVIKPAIKDIVFDTEVVTAGAGVVVQDLIDFCLDHNLVGLEEFSNIPGSVGGSVYINIHYFDYFLSDFLVQGRVIDKLTGQIQTVDKDWFKFGYNTSALHDKKYFLVSATFKLKKVDALQAAYAKGCRDQIIRHRQRRYPTERTCGSFFRNFYDNEVPLLHGKKIPHVAYYLDKVGVKGVLSVGKAQVSHQHANMIVTKEGATASDVIDLARKMQERVRNEFGIVPQAECQFLGFDRYPLHKIL
ncbi:MAG: UDP-N-acetylmuramate dehydrogenase [bacterium]